MLISHRYKFIFTKTVRTAGSSVEFYFERYCLPDGEWPVSHVRNEYVSESGIIGYRGKNPADSTWYNHMSAKRIRSLIGKDVWDQYFKFTVVRNPFDKLVSGFFMIKRPNLKNSHPQGQDLSQPQFSRGCNPIKQLSYATEIHHFKRWVKNLCILIDRDKFLIERNDVPFYLKPLEYSLFDRDKYVINGEECIDYFIKFENLNEDIEHVCNRLSIPFNSSLIPEFSKVGRPNNLPLWAYYDDESEKLVRELYAWEFERFCYDLSD